MRRFGCQTLSGLQERILHEPGVFPELLSFLTIMVSEMFRDPAFYRALREKVVPFLQTYPSLKIWVAGCSTGERFIRSPFFAGGRLLDRTLIYATDINPEALRKAKAGIYDLDRVVGFSKAYQAAGGRASLSDYYTAAYGSAVFDKALRGNTVFSDHSLATDHVFAEVQLVTCRNVLIYFDRALHNRAIGLFRDSLCRKGFLALGAKETLRFSDHAREFSEFAREERIYQKV